MADGADGSRDVSNGRLPLNPLVRREQREEGGEDESDAESQEDPLSHLMATFGDGVMQQRLKDAKDARNATKKLLKAQSREVRNEKRRTDRLKKKATALPSEHVMDILAFVHKAEQRKKNRAKAKAKAKAKSPNGAAPSSSSPSTTTASSST